jgi:hypothetical protein
MTDTTSTPISSDLERGYRRLIACYPRSFRKDNEEEILTVLLATAGEGQRRPSLAESADLLRGAIRMRMGLSRTPRTVLQAVRLMYLGAVAQLAVLIVVILTAGHIRAAVQAALTPYHNPALTAQVMHAVNISLVVDQVVIPVLAVLWLFMAWANGKGYDWARVATISLFGLSSAGMLVDLVQGAPKYAPAALIGAGVEWAIGLAAVVLILRKQSWPYYVRHPATR